jgi:hypothetical protein
MSKLLENLDKLLVEEKDTKDTKGTQSVARLEGLSKPSGKKLYIAIHTDYDKTNVVGAFMDKKVAEKVAEVRNNLQKGKSANTHVLEIELDKVYSEGIIFN